MAVDGVGFDVPRGEVLCLLGPSGCGKSTTLRIAAGLERPDSGLVFVGGRLVDGEGRHEPPETRRVGLMFQDYALFPHLSAKENVAFGLNRRPRAEREARADAELARVGLAALADAYPHTLSGGEQQRVALARAFVVRPKLLLADEPTGSLDTESGDSVIELMFELNRSFGTTLVMVTHDEHLAARCVRAVRLSGGRIVA